MKPIVIDRSGSIFAALVFVDGGKQAYAVLLQNLVRILYWKLEAYWKSINIGCLVDSWVPNKKL